MEGKLIAIKKTLGLKHERLKKILGHPDKANIAISFREEVGRTLNAAYYDHYTIRHTTGYPTIGVISPANQDEQQADRLTNFKAFIADEKLKHSLSFDVEAQPKIVPEVVVDIPEESGLLVIPGARRFPKPGEHHEERQRHEDMLIKKALLTGRPILAICGGSRKLWGHLGGQSGEVEGHTSPNMPTIEENGDIGNNIPLHRIKLTDNTLLKKCMDIPGGDNEPAVNSIHWGVALPTDEVLTRAQISAWSVELNPAEKVIATNTIEAFESKHGVPFFGIQWHPEAYYKTRSSSPKEALEYQRQQQIITYVAKAGDAYQAKQKMLKDFKQKTKPADSHTKIGFFKTPSPAKTDLSAEKLPVVQHTIQKP